MGEGSRLDGGDSAGTMGSESVRQRYALRAVGLENDARELERRDAGLSRARGVAFLVLAGLALVGLVRRQPQLGVAVAVTGCVFVVLVVTHARVATRQFELSRRQELVRRGLARIEGRYRAPETEAYRRGEAFREPGHPYAADLDLFGRGSLFEQLDVTQTPGGAARLASWLLAPAAPDVVLERQLAARELAREDSFREELALAGMRAAGGGRHADRHGILNWARGGRVSIPAAPLLPLLALQLLLGIASAAEGGAFTRAWGVAVLAQVVVGALLRGRVEAVLGPLGRQGALDGYRAMMALVEDRTFESTALRAARAVLCEAGRASAALADFDRRLGFAAVRHNALVQVIANVFFMWDIGSASRLEAWRRLHGSKVVGWLDSLGEFEALAALATFSAEHPEHCWPKVSGGGEASFRACGLGHPLVSPSARVPNDIALDADLRALMITGSNMSGKSTMLRSIGVAAVLAQAGAPVCATSVEMSTVRVWTSMRIDDSLVDGASHFFAEVRRLKAVVDAVRQSGNSVLFLLDEVLHGTNSRERILGAKAVIRHLVEEGAIGAVSSHDLGLVVLEEETHGRVRNTHFQEHVDGGTMGFDYRMRPGPVATSNALRLMREVGIDVVPLDSNDAAT